MTVELSASGDVVSVFGSETEPDLPAAVLRCLAEVRPECWGIVVMDARSAALVPEGVPHRLIGWSVGAPERTIARHLVGGARS